MRAAGGEAFDDDVVFGDQLLEVAVPVRQCLPERRRGQTHPLRPVRRAGKRRVVVDEVRIEVAVHGIEVSLGEQLLDERVDELLVVGHAIEHRRASDDSTIPRSWDSANRPRSADTGTVAHSPPVRTALQDLVRHCHSGLDAPDLQRRLLRSLRRLVPADAAFFATADPQSLLFTGGFAEEPLGAATPLFLDNEFGAEDVNKFGALATSSSHVASLDSVTSGDRFASPRYREIMRPLGLGDELRVALLAGSQCWGYLCLHRTDQSSGFTESELTLVASAAPHLGHALRQALLLHGPAPAGRVHEPGVVVLADDLSLVAVTAQASAYLAQMEPASGLPLPVCIYAAAAALRAIEDGTAPPGPCRRHASTRAADNGCPSTLPASMVCPASRASPLSSRKPTRAAPCRCGCRRTV